MSWLTCYTSFVAVVNSIYLFSYLLVTVKKIVTAIEILILTYGVIINLMETYYCISTSRFSAPLSFLWEKTKKNLIYGSLYLSVSGVPMTVSLLISGS